ncbi:MAG TPA: hypothetical protein VNI61_01900 [Gemmatimonadales bacterium]|nr:hypothetical protein [Gemmatimonadales bacterium]
MDRHPAWCAVALALTACYTYRPATIDTLPLGAEIRGLLATEARLTLEDSLGLGLADLRGTLVARSGDSLLVSIRSVDAGSTREGRPLYQRVALARRDVLRVDVKRLDRRRTFAVAAIVAGAAAVLLIREFRSNPGEPPCCGPPPPESPPAWGLRVPLPRD